MQTPLLFNRFDSAVTTTPTPATPSSPPKVCFSTTAPLFPSTSNVAATSPLTRLPPALSVTEARVRAGKTMLWESSWSRQCVSKVAYGLCCTVPVGDVLTWLFATFLMRNVWHQQPFKTDPQFLAVRGTHSLTFLQLWYRQNRMATTSLINVYIYWTFTQSWLQTNWHHVKYAASVAAFLLKGTAKKKERKKTWLNANSSTSNMA